MVNLLVRSAIGTLLAIGLAAGLGACNTMEGFGKDMAAAGRALSNSAERTKDSGSTASTNGAAVESTNSEASTSTATGSTTSGSTAVTPVTPTPLK